MPIFSIYSCAILSMKSSVIRSLSLGENPSEMCPHGSLIFRPCERRSVETPVGDNEKPPKSAGFQRFSAF